MIRRDDLRCHTHLLSSPTCSGIHSCPELLKSGRSICCDRQSQVGRLSKAGAWIGSPHFSATRGGDDSQGRFFPPELLIATREAKLAAKTFQHK